MTDFAELIRAVASLLWPTLAFAALLVFRKDIGAAMQRLRKATFGAHSVELDSDLKKLHEEVSPAAGAISGGVVALEGDSVQKILEMSAQSPKAALLLLVTAIEGQGRKALVSTGLSGASRQPRSLPRVVARLDEHYDLPAYLPDAVKLFQRVRNRIVHGETASDAQIMSALDSGVTIYRTLTALEGRRELEQG